MNLLEKLPPLKGELFETLAKQKNVKIVHIVSSDDLEEKEYFQDEDEFVLILEGEALLEVENEKKLLKKGEYFYIKSHTKHKILSVKNNTHWLAIYIK